MKKSKNQVSNTSHEPQKVQLSNKVLISHACFPYALPVNAVLQAQVFHIQSVFPPKTNLSNRRMRTRASRTHKTTHPDTGTNCSCNLYSLMMREADRKTGNYIKEFIPKVVIKIFQFKKKNAHYKHLVREYIHLKSQVSRLTCRSDPCSGRRPMGCTVGQAAQIAPLIETRRAGFGTS